MFLVWRKHGGMPTVVHQTQQEAKNEAERLARSFRNDEFIIFEATASVKVKDVEWTTLGHAKPCLDNEMPF